MPYLRNQDLVTRLHRRRYPLAVPVQQTRADGEHLRLVELLDGRFGQEDAAGGFGLCLDPLHEDAVQEGDEVLDGLDGERLRGLLVFAVADLQSGGPATARQVWNAP